MHPEVCRVFISKLNNVLDLFKKKRLLESCQVILATHSPFMIQSLSDYNNSISIISKENGTIKINPFDYVSQIRYPNGTIYSFGLVMYKVFGVATIELHNELYGILQEINCCFKENDIEKWFANNGITKSLQWIREEKGIPKPAYNVTLCTYIRNSIHHPENRRNQIFSPNELCQSIEAMLQLI